MLVEKCTTLENELEAVNRSVEVQILRAVAQEQAKWEKREARDNALTDELREQLAEARALEKQHREELARLLKRATQSYWVLRGGCH